MQAFLPELWLLEDSTSPTLSPAHLPHAVMEGTNIPCLPPFPLAISVLYSSLFEGEVHICAGETNEADRINEWTEESAELQMILSPHEQVPMWFLSIMYYSPRGKGLPPSHPPYSTGKEILCCLNSTWSKGRRWKTYLWKAATIRPEQNYWAKGRW